MAGGQQTPRQKMINMMYLVLLALLAMNVTNEVLNAFHIVNEGLQTSNHSLEAKNEDIYDAFNKQMGLDSAKARPFYDRAMAAKKVSDSLLAVLSRYKASIIVQAEPDTETGDLKRRDDLEISTKMFVEEGDGGNLRGQALRKKIKDTRVALLNLIDPQDRAEFHLPLTDSIPTSRENRAYPWEYTVFHNVPATAAVTILSKFQNDVISSEGIVIEYLIKKIGATEFHFTDLAAKLIPSSTYVLDGEQYKADIFLQAYNKSENPEVFMGPIGGFQKNPDGSYEPKLMDSPVPPGFGSTPIKAEDGFGKYEAVGSGVGDKTYTGVVRVKDPATNKYKFYPFEGKYQTAPKAVVVSPTKMNVLYIGVDNPMEISVPGVGQGDVQAVLQGSGSVKRDPANPANYIANVTGVGKCTINVSAKLDGKMQMMGAKEFRIKRIPDPIPMTSGRLRGGNVQPGTMRAQSGVLALLENFEFDARFSVMSFEMVYSSKGEVFKSVAQGPLFSTQMKNFIDRARPKDIIFIDEIKVVGPDHQPRKLGQIAFTVI